MGCDWEDRATMIRHLKETCYNAEKIIPREDKTWEMFQRHPELVVPNAKDHPDIFHIALGGLPTGTGALDVGTGDAGVLMWGYLTEAFSPPRVASDIFEIRESPGWERRILKGEDILEVFGENSFDHVQCCETLEHLDEDVGLNIAEQMIKVARKTALVTSCGLSHHLGPENMEKVKRNKYLDYKGQPSIEGLLDLGYKVALSGNYQIMAGWQA